jgi:hypothetical protein
MEEMSFFIIKWKIKKIEDHVVYFISKKHIIQILLNEELLFIYIFHKTWILTFNNLTFNIYKFVQALP